MRDLPSEGKIWDIKGRCPRCGEEIVISEYLYNAPLVGMVILASSKCDRCGYTYRNVRAAESLGPQRLKLYVDDPDDLNILVVRASSASIYIPEFGISIEPGPASEGFITTVEGILNRILNVLKILARDEEVDPRKLSKVESDLRNALEGRRAFTLIIRDPDGVSRIISDKVEKERLYREDVKD